MCSPIGKLIGLDAPTVRRTRPSIARARVEIDPMKRGIDKVRMEIWSENGDVIGFWQRMFMNPCPLSVLRAKGLATSRRCAGKDEGGRRIM